MGGVIRRGETSGQGLLRWLWPPKDRTHPLSQEDSFSPPRTGPVQISCANCYVHPIHLMCARGSFCQVLLLKRGSEWPVAMGIATSSDSVLVKETPAHASMNIRAS